VPPPLHTDASPSLRSGVGVVQHPTEVVTMGGEEYSDEEIHWVESIGRDGFSRELAGEGVGDLVKEEFESPGS
jgi:hypothetical protein